MKTIILITNSFPFGIAEKSFIVPEFEILKEKFQFVIVARNTTEEQTTAIPDGIPIYRYDVNKNYQALQLLIRSLFCKDLYKELLQCIRARRLCKRNIIKIVRFMMRSLHFGTYLKSIRTQCPGDVVYYTYWNDYATYSCVKMKKNDKVVSRIHRADLYLLENNQYYLPYKNLTNARIDRLVFISEEGREYYKKTFEKGHDKLRLHYLGVKKREKLAPFAEHDGIKILSFSYLSPVKRVERIIEVLSKIDNVTIEWTHIGGGSLEEEIKKMALERLGNKKNVVYRFAGYMQNEDALNLVSQTEYDFLLNVSYSEGLPVTMMEAMSLGIPVIATKVGGVDEIVTNGENGFLIQRDFSTEELCNLLYQYHALRLTEKMELRQNAYGTWEKRFFDAVNYSNFAKELEEL